VWSLGSVRCREVSLHRARRLIIAVWRRPTVGYRSRSRLYCRRCRRPPYIPPRRLSATCHDDDKSFAAEPPMPSIYRSRTVIFPRNNLRRYSTPHVYNSRHYNITTGQYNNSNYYYYLDVRHPVSSRRTFDRLPVGFSIVIPRRAARRLLRVGSVHASSTVGEAGGSEPRGGYTYTAG